MRSETIHEARRRAEDAEKLAQTRMFIAAQEHTYAEEMHGFAVEALALLRIIARATEVRPLPGVYFLLTDTGNVCYVGQSDNVACRMAGHKDKPFASIRMLHVADAAERDRLEQRFIHALTPPLNVARQNFNRVQEMVADPRLYRTPDPDGLRSALGTPIGGR